MRNIFLLLMVIDTTMPGTSPGQYGNVWVFGQKAGVDFNSNPARPIVTNVNTLEGSASIADANGKLLFYTDGGMVWDRNSNVMPNGKDLPGVRYNITNSTAQGALIVPVPGNADQYYVFSLGEMDSRHEGKLFYSIIDLSLNGGLGDVFPGSSGKLLTQGLTEQLTAVSGNSCNIWLLTTAREPYAMKAYNIDYRGIDTIPVVSPGIPGGGKYKGIIGTVDISPDRNKVAMAQGNIVLYDFDPGTGAFSNSFLLEPSVKHNFYGIAFSPGNTKLYASGEDDSLYQFDLSSKDTNIIPGTRTALGKAWQIKRGPDGKIYAATQRDFLAVVQQPDRAGIACRFEPDGLKLADGTSCRLGLPNSATVVENIKRYSSVTDTVRCADSFLLAPRKISGFNHQWEDGSIGSEHYVSRSGTYWVRYLSVSGSCEEYVDTFRISFYPIIRKYSTTVYTGMCNRDTILMQPKADAAHYVWEDGSTNKERKVNQKGIYWVTYQVDSLCRQYADTFVVDYPARKYEVAFVTDTLACAAYPVLFKNTSAAPFDQFQWLFGDGASSLQPSPTHSYTQAGLYEAMLIGKIGNACSDTAVRFIAVDSVFPLAFLMDKNRICMGEKITFYAVAAPTTLKLSWVFGDGVDIREQHSGAPQHAYAQHGLFPVTLTAHNRVCPETRFTDTVFVLSIPEIDLGEGAGLCSNSKILELRNLRSSPGMYQHLWNTGDTTPTLKVTHPGTYSLSLIPDSNGCSNSASIIISKDCYMDIPNVFTPNGDGVNDYFFPRKLLSRSISRFRMKIFDRWGQPVFEARQVEGRGWDGRLNGRELPEGTYIYIIEIDPLRALPEQHKGNVTLVR